MVSGPLDREVVATATAQLLVLDGEHAEPINVVINSPGGPFDDALPLLDTLRVVRAPLTIDVLGRAEGSAGVVVAAAPGNRRLGATASISLRLGRPRVPTTTADDLLRLADAKADLERSVATVIADRSGQTVDWVLDQFDRGVAIRGNEAVDLGLVDEIR